MSETERLFVEIGKLQSMLTGFITAKAIDPEEAKKLSEFVSLVDTQRRKWALNEKRGRSNGLVIYGAYRAVYQLLYNIRVALIEAHARGENPTTAERAQEVIEDIESTLKLASEAVARDSPVLMNQLEQQTLGLYERGRQQRFFPSLKEEICRSDKRDILPLFNQLQEQVVISAE